MSFEWSIKTWGDLVTLEYGKGIRDYKQWQTGYPVYGTNGVIGWYNKPLCDFPSVIVGRKGAYRGVFYSEKPFFVIDTAFYLKPKIDLYTLWAYYSLLSYDINSMDSGSATPSTSRTEFYKLKVHVPPIKEQEAIANFLKSLDDRITLLRDTNTTLESIAQAIFKSWFVDFDPVRAKAEGRAPEGIDAETATLFPDNFEESQLGLVPKGWRRLPFREAIDVISGGTPKTSVSEYWNGNIPWFSIVDAPGSSDVFVIDTEKQITKLAIKNSSIKLLPPGTTIISARGTVGRLALAGKEMAINQSCYGLRGKTNDVYFTYFTTCQLVERLKQYGHGSVFNTITRNTFDKVLIIYPDKAVIEQFEAKLFAIMERIKKNNEQSQTLSTLRDTLLPRLISGQLRVPEAEVILEKAL